MKANPENRNKLGQFVKGQSGNPGGRPKGISLAAVLADELSVDDARKVIRAIVKAAKDGDVRAFQALIDRTDGKVPQGLTGGIDDDGNDKPIPLKIVSE